MILQECCHNTFYGYVIKNTNRTDVPLFNVGNAFNLIEISASASNNVFIM